MHVLQQNLVEQEEEFHINRMMKRLEGLREQQQNLANQVWLSHTSLSMDLIIYLLYGWSRAAEK